MTARRLVTAMVLAGGLGVLLATPLGSQRRFSVQVWLAVAASWLAFSVVRQILQAVPSAPHRPRRRWPWAGRGPVLRNDDRPKQLRTMHVLVQSACDNNRGHAVRLRPRLRRVAEHFLPLRHGISGDLESPQARAVLGDVAWLVEPGERERVPTPEEIDRFLDRVLMEVR